MGQETQGKATSPEDVRRQTQGEPTAAQQGTTGTAGRSDKMDQADRLWSTQELSTGRGKKPNAWTACDRPRSSPDLGKALDLHPRASQSRDRKGIAYYEIAPDAGRAQGLHRIGTQTRRWRGINPHR